MGGEEKGHHSWCARRCERTSARVCPQCWLCKKKKNSARLSLSWLFFMKMNHLVAWGWPQANSAACHLSVNGDKASSTRAHTHLIVRLRPTVCVSLPQQACDPLLHIVIIVVMAVETLTSGRGLQAGLPGSPECCFPWTPSLASVTLTLARRYDAVGRWACDPEALTACSPESKRGSVYAHRTWIKTW